ncbi:hypothetical protein E5F05_11180 [Deinococcus metallilatus]|uniref:Capsid protein n=1 Tax=Deinococcus metallilatus TaxID=1211322 RepID=A0AAJ5F5F2_9DEIO|nr:hypothetical protein [Deinococcus metallilatus]MBB5296518.1 capsid protein [Deinococcus metallilatus]QBY08451.1 hypothetical protein E5F05_11180 [Deinococcus metallilatus]RXJ11250.1 hypothetical protein ERJ73_10000 [Deinococcus metallilatus]TLK24741.1 hypothetical protein FCS05_14435 [Deinococcus metallilatus]GMA17435.1 hypothetical protein GCM10025871_37660 [Deinococcus metallilatus]
MTAPQSAAGVLAWPSGLSADTPLPFAVWRVLHHVDGQRNAAEVAQLARTTPQDVMAALNQAAAWATRAAQRTQPVTDASAQAVTQCVIAVVGPMGEFMVDDVLDELGDGAALSTLLSRVAAQLSEAQVQAFVRHLRARGIA